MVKQYYDANKAWLIQNIIGHPSTDDYINYVQRNLIPNCPVTKANILHVEDILGPNLGSLKGKTTRKPPEKVTINSCDELPNGVLEEHGNVMLAADIMYINQIPFMMTTSRAMHFGTAEIIKNKKTTKKSLIHAMPEAQNMTLFGRWAIRKYKKIHRGNGHNAPHDRTSGTCPRNRAIH